MLPFSPSSVSSSASTSRDTEYQTDLRPEVHSRYIPPAVKDDDALAQQRLDKFVELVYGRLKSRTHLAPGLDERLKAIEICLGIDAAESPPNRASRKQRNHLTDVRDKSHLTAALFSTISSLTARLDEAETALEASAAGLASHQSQIDDLARAVALNTLLFKQLAHHPPPPKPSDTEPTITVLALQQALNTLQSQIQQHEMRSKASEEAYTLQNGKFETRLDKVKRSKYHLSLSHASPREPLPKCPLLWPHSPAKDRCWAPSQADPATVENMASAVELENVPAVAPDSTTLHPPSSQPSSSELSDPSSIYTPPFRNAGVQELPSPSNDVAAEPPLPAEQPFHASPSSVIAEPVEDMRPVAMPKGGAVQDDSVVSQALPDADESIRLSALASTQSGLADAGTEGRWKKAQTAEASPSPAFVPSELAKSQRKVSFRLTKDTDEPKVAGASHTTRNIAGVLKKDPQLPSRWPASASNHYPAWLVASRPSQAAKGSAQPVPQPASASSSANGEHRKTKSLSSKAQTVPQPAKGTQAVKDAKSKKGAPTTSVEDSEASAAGASGSKTPGSSIPVKKDVPHSSALCTSASDKQAEEGVAAIDASNHSPPATKKRRRDEEVASNDAQQKQGQGAPPDSATPRVPQRAMSPGKERNKARLRELREKTKAKKRRSAGQTAGSSASRGHSEADGWWELPLSQSSPSSQSSRQASSTSAQGSAAASKSKEEDATKEQAGSDSSRGHRDSDFDLWGSAAGSSPCPHRSEVV